MRENKFETDFDNENGDKEANISFDIDVPDDINDSRNEDGDRNPGIVHGFGTGCDKHGGFVGAALFFEVECEREFKSDAHNEYGECWSIVFNPGGFDEFFDGFDYDAFNFFAMVGSVHC